MALSSGPGTPPLPCQPHFDKGLDRCGPSDWVGCIAMYQPIGPLPEDTGVPENMTVTATLSILDKLGQGDDLGRLSCLVTPVRTIDGRPTGTLTDAESCVPPPICMTACNHVHHTGETSREFSVAVSDVLNNPLPGARRRQLCCAVCRGSTGAYEYARRGLAALNHPEHEQHSRNPASTGTPGEALRTSCYEHDENEEHVRRGFCACDEDEPE